MDSSSSAAISSRKAISRRRRQNPISPNACCESPRFAAAFLISLVVFGALGGGRLLDDPTLWLTNLRHLFLLQAPILPTAFAGTPYPAINGSMWSIGYELRCYLAVLVVGVAGGFARPLILAATVVLIVCSAAIGDNLAIWPTALDALLGHFGLSLSLFGVFACGSCLFLFREKIIFTPGRCGLALLALAIGLRVPLLSTIAIETAGAYLLFAFVFALKNRRLGAVGSPSTCPMASISMRSRSRSSSYAGSRR